MNPRVSDIIATIEERAQPRWQEDFDNTGWQILLPGTAEAVCTGVMLCVDVTASIIDEARSKGCNLILAHHPLLFRGVKRIDDSNRVGDCIIRAIQAGISIYSCHTSVDKAPQGVSFALAEKFGLVNEEILRPGEYAGTGLGVVGDLPHPLTVHEFIDLIKECLNSPIVRCSGLPPEGTAISRVAFGGGACSDLIPDAIAHHAQVMVTSDVKHNLFLDFSHRIGIIDVGHFESEECTKEIFYNTLTEKFPNFVPYYSQTEINPITYL